MPTYAHTCDNGHDFDLVLRFSELERPQFCECGAPATRVICAPMVFVQADICYDSPVTGEAITSKQKRIEDLKRHNCIEYDPGMKQDYQRRIQEGEKQLDAKVDAFVDQQISTMPARKREKLESELKSGVVAEATRITPEQVSAR